ncbi:MAG: cupin domain-containing protein [Oscillospiraceae bacterium]|nr:cupin domain-containing protein [Oscillospiraceae bacterium]
METRIMEIAQRIRELREILELSPEEMAARTNTSLEEYLKCENGESDFSFTFLYQCAHIFGVDLMELVTGENPKLSFYSIVRKNEGLPIRRRAGFSYNHLAYLFKDKLCEPFLVTAPYKEEEQNQEIHLSYHKGQEFDYIISGRLKVRLEEHIHILEPGDAIYYDSGHGHGMIATGGEDCQFLAVVLKDENEEDKLK